MAAGHPVAAHAELAAPVTHIEIDAAGRRVSLRHDGELTEVVASAIHAWRSTSDHTAAEPERLGAVGFSAALELAGPPTRADHDQEVTAR